LVGWNIGPANKEVQAVKARSLDFRRNAEVMKT